MIFICPHECGQVNFKKFKATFEIPVILINRIIIILLYWIGVQHRLDRRIYYSIDRIKELDLPVKQQDVEFFDYTVIALFLSCPELFMTFLLTSII